MVPEHDYVDLHVLARCYHLNLSVPEIIFVRGRNVTPARYLEDLAAHGKDECPSEVASMLEFVNQQCSVSVAAAALLARLRLIGKLPDGRRTVPLEVNVANVIEGLRTLASIYRAERAPAAKMRVAGHQFTTVGFLSGLRYNKGECPAIIAANVGVPFQPATIAEVATALLGRLRQAGQL